MALEDLTGTKYIDSLNSSNPTATDGVSEGDDHIRGIKNVLKTTFPGVSGAVTSTHTELNLLDGATVALASVTATAAELNILDGVTSTAAELNELDASAAAVTDFISGVREYIYDGSTEQSFDVTGNLASGIAESIGPTGSGATNIWTALDALPSNAKAVIISVHDRLQAAAVQVSTSGHSRAYKTGATATGRDDFYLTYISTYNHSGASATPTFSQVCRNAVIPLDGSKTFTFTFTNVANVNSRTIELYLNGFLA